MQTRKLILSGAIALILAAMLGNLVLAGSIDTGVPTSGDLQVYLIKKTFDICDPNLGGISGSAALPGGSIPPSGQQFGCVRVVGERLNEYLFTGEQMAVLVAARNTLGSEGIMDADLSVGGDMKVQCNDITVNASALKAGNLDWFGHDVSADLNEQPPAKTAGTTDGFDLAYDKLYQCVYTATPSDSGEVTVSVVVSGKNGAGEAVTAESVPDQVWFNPEIMVDVFTSDGGPVAFDQGSSGQTVYSTNTLKIKNEAEGGVDLVAWIAGTDLVSSTPQAKCPASNVLDVENYMEYRCKIGTLFNNPWNFVQNPDDTEECTIYGCQGATPLTPNIVSSYPISILANGHTAECWFRLSIPTPCFGTYDLGEILVYARAI